jgi:signal transduction histidine kinase
MATVKKIIEEHGGAIEVASEEGKGTKVSLTIPDQGSARAMNEDTTDRLKAIKIEVS